MEKRKKILAVLVAVSFAISIFAPMLLIRQVTATDPDSWYTNVSGVLESDYYSLYPFEKKNLKIGFSKFGEMIDSRSTYNIGLEYGTRDPFAPPAGSSVPADIPKHKWSQGWLINITYYHVPTGQNRNVWACALHADLTDYGNDWIRVDNDWYGGTSGGPTYEYEEDPRDPGRLISDPTSETHTGGRKTNGTVTTDAIRVLYNGPRMYIARTVNHVKDWIQTSNTTGTDEPLVDVVFTLIFNKVKKQVIVLKDIKITTTKFVVGPIWIPGMQSQESGLIIQFSNRGEWDLGPSSGSNAFQSYVHLYRGDYALSTVYDSDYHLNPTTPPSVYSSYGSQPGASGTYDLAQIISADLAYVGWAAFWPALSDWSVDAGRQDQWWKSLMAGDTHSIDGVGGEPFRSPYLIGEWDFFLTETRSSVGGRYFDRQFRGVTVYGVTDLWDGDDAGRSGGSNNIDAEVEYQVEEVMNPWDLYSAIHKDTRRWVQFHNVTTAEKTAADAGTDLNITLVHRPVTYAPIWESYCNFSERVMWGGELKYPARSPYYSGSSLSTYEPYELYVNATGHGNVTIRAASVPAAGTVIKILYSTNCTYDYTHTAIANYFGGSLSLGNNTLTVTNATKGLIVPNLSINSTSWTDVFDVVQNITILYDEFMFVTNVTEGVYPSAGQILTGIDDLNITVDVKIPPEGGNITVYNSTYYGVAPISPVSNIQNFTFYGNMSIMYKVNPPNSLSSYAHEYVHITGSILVRANHTLYSTGSAYGVTANYTIAEAALRKEIMGRYEWVVVGNHSRAIDSVGAAMVSEAFKEKQVIADNGGLDQMDMWGTRVPYLLSDLGNATWRAGGPAWTDIYDSLGRLAYIDDWCSRYPVSSSNIVTVAGPSANLFSEYFNEFAQAIQIYGITSGNLIDVIFATTCWNTTAGSNYLGQYYYSDGQFYSGNTSTGIGVITTYKDINGTVGFMIYGWSGDDTYYTCKWFQEYGAYYLQTENRGVTTLVVRLEYLNITAISSNPRPPYYTYDAHFPRVTIIERLGTISEKTPHDP
ncbi:MAG: hypothetical protein K6T73_05770 [Candidatus Bathyarchaeota archaeon]|nr:hypothetical protein [Candidatus Bathyarchaeota archaeon]